MTDIEMYKQFRQELDDICVPEILKYVLTKPIYYDEKKVGILCYAIQPTHIYIDCVYVLPEYRRKGLAKKSVLELYGEHKDAEIRLHIIINNTVAQEFWSKLFVLECIDIGNIDVLYKIVRLQKECPWCHKIVDSARKFCNKKCRNAFYSHKRYLQRKKERTEIRIQELEGSFERRLKRILIERNVSQSELAAGIGVSKAAVCHYLSGEHKPRAKTLKKISEFLSVDIKILMPEEPFIKPLENGDVRKVKIPILPIVVE